MTWKEEIHRLSHQWSRKYLEYTKKKNVCLLPKSLWEKKGFHFASKAEGEAGLPIFHPWVKGPEEKDVLEILREILKAEETLRGDHCTYQSEASLDHPQPSVPCSMAWRAVFFLTFPIR